MAKPNSCPPTQVPPYPMGVGLSGGGAPIPRVNQCPNPSPTIPHGLKTLFGQLSTCLEYFRRS
ncbi:hypothetical protein HanRHA438_Chr15g0686751 [Helianthus annuus]|nr:hypothetical protein HanRHA438_Chr15g0686751 [Helianthus annuus]